jgi:Family of unknown function (DUF6499)
MSVDPLPILSNRAKLGRFCFNFPAMRRSQDMAPIDWRRPETYEKIRDLDAVGFAWEYLRRNPGY